MAWRSWLIAGRRWSSLVRSLQTATATIGGGATTGTATITAVVTANTIVLSAGALSNEDVGSSADYLAYLGLTNPTTVTASRIIAGPKTVTPRFVVLEFQPGILRSCQYGSVTVTAALSGTATLSTAVNPAKACVLWLGQATSRTELDGLLAGKEWDFDLVLTNPTTITATHSIASGSTWTMGFVVPEFY